MYMKNKYFKVFLDIASLGPKGKGKGTLVFRIHQWEWKLVLPYVDHVNQKEYHTRAYAIIFYVSVDHPMM